MKRKTLGLIHTSATLVPVFAQLCKDKLPGVDVFNIADDSLIKDVIRRGELTPQTARRVAGHVASAEEAGADYILVTCSSIGRAVEAAAAQVEGAGVARGPADGRPGGANGQKNRRDRHAADHAGADGGFDSTPRGKGRKENRR